MVIVLAPRTRPCAAWRWFQARALRSASTSTPQWVKKWASSAAMTARSRAGLTRSSDTGLSSMPSQRRCTAPSARRISISGVTTGVIQRNESTASVEPSTNTAAAKLTHRRTSSHRPVGRRRRRTATRRLVARRGPSCTCPCRRAGSRVAAIGMAETRIGPHGLAFAPTKIGVLIDLDMGTKDGFLACLGFGVDGAYEQGVILRPVELVVKEAIGLPRLEARNAIAGYRWLVEQGVLCTIGPLITDNSIALAPVIDACGVPAVTWTGTDRYFGDYCFNLGNGGLAEEAAIMATWIRRSGYRTVGMIHEISPGGVEYA